jgi:hypothetical protein
MKGTSIRTKDLVIYELDQRTGVWNKMPDSQVDEMTSTVSVPLRHNGTYANGRVAQLRFVQRSCLSGALSSCP